MGTQQFAELETRTYRNIYDDGLWDLVLGAFFLSLGIGLLTGTGLPAALVGVIAISIRNSLRKSIIEPRIGYVPEFAPMWCFLASGGAISASGLFVLMRFLRRNPKV